MWKDVVGYENLFMVSDQGEIYSKRSRKKLKQNLVGTGYLAHVTKIGGRKGKNVVLRAHRLVAKAFLPNTNNLPEVNHKDGNKLNNNVSNLEWCTSSENKQHAYDTGLKKKLEGVHNPKSKLTEEQVVFIRKNARKNGGSMTIRKLAKMFEISHTAIPNITNGVSYKNVK